MSRPLLLATLTFAPLTATPLLAEETPDDKAGIEYFEEHIRPVLVDYCYKCHSAEVDEPAGGLRLDLRETMRAGGELGPAVVPGDTSESLILSALRYDDLEMPPSEKLEEDVVRKFEKWIKMGAPDPRTSDPEPDPEPAPEPESKPDSSSRRAGPVPLSHRRMRIR